MSSVLRCSVLFPLFPIVVYSFPFLQCSLLPLLSHILLPSVIPYPLTLLSSILFPSVSGACFPPSLPPFLPPGRLPSLSRQLPLLEPLLLSSLQESPLSPSSLTAVSCHQHPPGSHSHPTPGTQLALFSPVGVIQRRALQSHLFLPSFTVCPVCGD